MRIRINTLLAKSGYSSKPHFLIIGAQKAGTSGLLRILNQHSLLKASVKKEIHYFDNDDWYAKERIYEYHSYFPLPLFVPENGKLFEATPSYIFHSKAANRIHSYNPDLKLIALLRDPSKRAFSAWTMYHHHFKTGKYSHLNDHRKFSEAISEEMESLENGNNVYSKSNYIKRGIYSDQINAYFKYFSKDQLLFVESNELQNQVESTIKKILTFIDIPYEKLELIKSNKSRIDESEEYKSDLLNLKNFYRPYNKKLFQIIEREFDWND